jgi:hypothetical protein
VFSALLVLSDTSSFFSVCRRALCCLGLFYVGLFSVRTFFFSIRCCRPLAVSSPCIIHPRKCASEVRNRPARTARLHGLSRLDQELEMSTVKILFLERFMTIQSVGHFMTFGNGELTPFSTPNRVHRGVRSFDREQRSYCSARWSRSPPHGRANGSAR